MHDGQILSSRSQSQNQDQNQNRNYSHSHYRPITSHSSVTPSATAANVAVAVAVLPPWALPANPSSTIPASVSTKSHYYRDPSRSAPSPSPSLINAHPHHKPPGPRLPRTSSLLPPPRIEPSPRAATFERSDRLSPAPGQQVPHNAADSSWLLNRLSSSTVSTNFSRAPAQSPRANHSRLGNSPGIDATTPIDNSPPPSKPSPRKLRKNYRPTTSLFNVDAFASGQREERSQLPQSLPLIVALSPLEPPAAFGSLLNVESEGAGPGSGPSEPGGSKVARQEGQSLTKLNTQDSPAQSATSTPASVRSMASYRPNMPYDQDQEVYATQRGHSRGRSKGSNEKVRVAKPPSQKAMLHRALQKANTAVQLDNAQNFTGAREAYAEACDLLQQVLQKTTGDEDKRKLEAIVRTPLGGGGYFTNLCF